MTAFRAGQPLAWTFHRGTARWVFNTPTAGGTTPTAGRETPLAPWLALPPAAVPDAPLGRVIGDRVSCRAFADTAIGLDALATILHTAYGVLGRSADNRFDIVDRPVPSAGGLYPLELSVLVRAVQGVESGVHHYLPHAHGLERLRTGALPPSFTRYLFMGQDWVVRAAVVLVVSAVTHRSLTKYGDRGYRYLLFEAGHVVQNANLVATALGLGAVNLGGFFDDELAGLLRIDVEQEIPLYATAIGTPDAADRMGRRALPEPVPPESRRCW